MMMMMMMLLLRFERVCRSKQDRVRVVRQTRRVLKNVWAQTGLLMVSSRVDLGFYEASCSFSFTLFSFTSKKKRISPSK